MKNLISKLIHAMNEPKWTNICQFVKCVQKKNRFAWTFPRCLVDAETTPEKHTVAPLHLPCCSPHKVRHVHKCDFELNAGCSFFFVSLPIEIRDFISTWCDMCASEIIAEMAKYEQKKCNNILWASNIDIAMHTELHCCALCSRLLLQCIPIRQHSAFMGWLNGEKKRKENIQMYWLKCWK